MINKIKAICLMYVITCSVLYSNGTNWNNDQDYGNVVGAMNIALTTNSGNSQDSNIKQVLNVIKKITEKKKLRSQALAKETLKVFLINDLGENRVYRFKPEQNLTISTVRDIFMRHIKKHFSNEDGTFGEQGRHSRVLKGGSNLKDDEIEAILSAIIENNNFEFIIEQNRLKIKPSRDIGRVGDIIGSHTVYKLEGDGEDNFNSVTQTEIKDLDKLKFFFQLHLFPTAAGTNFSGDGRYGSCYITS